MARALDRLGAATSAPTPTPTPTPAATAAAAAVLAAADTLPPWARGQAPTPAGGPRAICHGDWHLGQLVHFDPLGWRMIDIDDLGVGDPAWDLARPAAWYAAGLLPQAAWGRFLSAYHAAGGPALAPDRDPWVVLDIPARALTVQAAALSVAKAIGSGAELGQISTDLVACCERM